MKKALTSKLNIYLLLAFACLSIVFVSCEKIPGHSIATTPVVKSGTMTFTVGDTTHTLTTTADTVSFYSITTPVTTVTAKNGQKTLSCVFSFDADIAGTFTISALTLVIPQGNGYYKFSSSNAGSVTVDSINVAGGYISGSLTSPIQLPSGATSTLTGTFAIQQ